jgi:hypothetical protein
MGNGKNLFSTLRTPPNSTADFLRRISLEFGGNIEHQDGALIADRRILVRKIPREKAKSALGYLRTSSPARAESQDAAEELSPMP